ncbi:MULTISPECIES: 4'-phosphopantetheinyl transferase [unclassified Mesorhizobium]|uniref:4'-phosphopantetheinyl transferase family protein n=1 Tax=unclassified Mesorhizobium TaxID=325217 RepID=UPI001CCBE370|nr:MULTISPECIES: 4'-phosphopantetheinyl transferase superfamily protein [unclassified Mesorhizobium]MBZ9815242.1 4'-phosphopantetheinyl transferase superfamily protein [Mesorhizobium sp. CA7]MBZ9845109.1 4'-phosphopantetheinyl transferase superfamily protein [Mesorhizobium sp. CA5]MBZ9862083.1 4'-phosphopantetheinyl transferase superfamily protein [Mesorhizobium sp. CA12]
MVLPVGSDIRSDCSAAQFVASFRELVADDIGIEGGDFKPADRDLPLKEEAHLGNVVPARRREFRAGRLYARKALRGLGIPETVIPIGPDRAPIWPTGAVGSISHTRSLCAVAVGLSADYLGIGIDIEENSSLSGELAKLVTHTSELNERDVIEARLGYDLPKLLFVIKEAFYKMHFPLNRRFLAFRDVRVELDVERHAAKAVIVSSSRFVAADTFDGRFGSSHGTLFSCFALSAP